MAKPTRKLAYRKMSVVETCMVYGCGFSDRKVKVMPHVQRMARRIGHVTGWFAFVLACVVYTPSPILAQAKEKKAPLKASPKKKVLPVSAKKKLPPKPRILSSKKATKPATPAIKKAKAGVAKASRKLTKPVKRLLPKAPLARKVSKTRAAKKVLKASTKTKRRNPPPKRKKKVFWVPRVDVIGERPVELDSVPGSADIVSKKELKARAPLNAGEVLRTMPGVNVYGEDGMGLRLNIGIRGLDPVRGRKILVLEDGIPIAMAPYGEPELYYTPKIERMKRLELVKGSGSILWGPQTIGGVLNFITRDPPRKLRVTAEARYGSYDYFLAQASVGNTINKRFGYLLEVIHQRYAGPTNLQLSATDISGKVVMRISSRNILGVKLHFYDEMSNSTYLGLTSPQYINNPYANHAIHDRFPIRRIGGSINHKLFFGTAGFLNTQFYAHHVKRFWQRQDFARSGSGNDLERVINGDNKKVGSSIADGSSIYFKRSTGNRNRQFGVTGLESRYTLEFTSGPIENELIVGIRFHYEHGDEQYLNGENEKSPSGFIRDQEDRDLFAIAAYVQNSFMLMDRKLKITPGFRFESMQFFRHLARTRVKQADGTRKAMDTDIRESSSMYAPIPGIGLSYQVTTGLFLFGGVHRGFAPPRTKDSITADGDDLELDPEFSWNYELGFRMRRGNYLLMQAAGFVMDFQNQVIAPSESSGAVAADPGNLGKSKINAGQTRHIGGEASITFDLPAFLGAPLRMPLSLSYTWVPVAEFVDGKYKGNRLPYAPEHSITASLRLELPFGLTGMFSANYVSQQTADKGETITPSTNGLVGLIEGRLLLNARLAYTFRVRDRSIGVFIAGKNLTNVVYITSRRPQGIRVGEPLRIFGGIQGQL